MPAVRWLVLLPLVVLSSCLEPRQCRVDDDCPYASTCEVRVGQDGGVCRQVGDAGP